MPGHFSSASVQYFTATEQEGDTSTHTRHDKENMAVVFLILVKFSSSLCIKTELKMAGFHHAISIFNFFYLLGHLGITFDPMLVEVNRSLFTDIVKQE